MEKPESAVAVSSRSMGSIESTVKRYGIRYWAVYLNGKLLAVTLYKKGALAVQAALLSRSGSSEKSS